MKNIFLECNRVYLRYITQDDFINLKSILQNPEVMYAWEYQFKDKDVQEWIDKNQALYRKYNLGYFIIEDKLSHKILGQAALMPDFIENRLYHEIGYILKKEYWHNGFAAECAKALTDYAFKKLNLKEVIFEIRPSNNASRNVAERLGAKIEGEFIKNVRGKDMIHLIYKLPNFNKKSRI